MLTWITDENNNKCSVEFWGTEEKAKEALASLKDCRSCVDCRYCSYCSDCRSCVDCRYCSSCVACVDCVDCRYCSSCVACVDCVDCSSCSSCSSCSDCSSCVDCSSCGFCSKKNQNEKDKSIINLLKNPPVIEDIHKKVYEAVTSQGHVLNMEAWHTCDTTHCRAGWVVHLAGDDGYALEKETSTQFAASQIYKASGYLINPSRFYDSNEAAMEDIKKLAEVES